MSTGDPFSMGGGPLSAKRPLAPPAPVNNVMGHFQYTPRGSTTRASFEDRPTLQADFNSINSALDKLHYSIEELKHFRDSLLQVVCNLAAMKDCAGDILTLPYGILSNPNAQPIATRKLKQLPRGNEMCSRFDVQHRSTGDSDNEEIVYRGHQSRKPLGSSTQWQYRRSDRSLTDDAKSMQPQTAPMGVDAQKAENFRKFYRAVVSPTHVRVTAGGRIVPNSRAPAQPVFIWNKDRVAFDTVASSVGAAAQLNGGGQAGSKRSQGTGSSFDTTGQTSTRSSYQKSDSSATAQSLESKDATAQYSAGGVALQPQLQVGSQGIKISPPENFDPNRPFYLNGCLVSPLPRGNKLPLGLQAVPLSMIENPAQQHNLQYQQQQQMMGAFHSTAQPFGASQNQNQRLMPGMTGPSAYSYQPPSQFVGLPVPETVGSRLNHHKSTPALKTNVYQIDRLSPKSLNAKKKSFEDEIQRIDHQLKYNTHQTDEKHENQKRQHIQQQIDQITAQLDAMGFAPMAQQPRASVLERRGAAVSVKSLDMTKPLNVGDTFAEPSGSMSGASTGLKSQVSLRETASESIPRSAMSTLSTLDSDSAPKFVTVSAPTAPKPAFVSKKRLSPSSAKAPEFKPRSLLAAESVNKPTMIDNDSTVVMTPEKAVMEVKKTAQSFFPVSGPGFSENENKRASNDEAGEVSAHRLAYNAAAPATDMYQNTAQYQHVPLSIQHPAISNVGPYLSGYTQPGNHESGSREVMFHYSRDLTGAELLARKLYWGSGGKQHQQKGLPKFDGKDFYPPSPQKTPTAPADQSRASEASTVVRKYNSSALTSKASEESGVLQKLDEEDAPVTPRKNHVIRNASAPGLELKSTDENKENVEIIKSTEDLDAWCAKNDIHMPDGGTPTTRTKTATLLAKLANIPSPRIRFTRDSKPASVAASERSESYALPKLLARGASKAVAAASDQFATAMPSASTQMSAMSNISKLQMTTPVVVGALQVRPFQGELKRPSPNSSRSVSGSIVGAAVIDPAMGRFAGPGVARTEPVANAQDIDVNDRPQLPNSNAAREYLQMIARNADARRAQDAQGPELQNVAGLRHQAESSGMVGQKVKILPEVGTKPKTAVESLAVHQQEYVAKNLPLHPRPEGGMGYILPAAPAPKPASLMSYPRPPSIKTPLPEQAHPVQVAPPMPMLPQQMPFPPAIQFQYPGPPMPYHMSMVPGQHGFPVPTGQIFAGPTPAPGQPYPLPMHPGQLFAGPPPPAQGHQGHWVWHGAGGPPVPPQGPPPAR